MSLSETYGTGTYKGLTASIDMHESAMALQVHTQVRKTDNSNSALLKFQ